MPAETRRALRWEGVTGTLPFQARPSWLRRAWGRLATRPSPAAATRPAAAVETPPPAPARRAPAAAPLPGPLLRGARAFLAPPPGLVRAELPSGELTPPGADPAGLLGDAAPLDFPDTEPSTFAPRP